MNSTRPGHYPPEGEVAEAVNFTAPFARLDNDHARPSRFGRFPRRIEGHYCPFCAGSIPEEYVYCPHCGKGV